MPLFEMYIKGDEFQVVLGWGTIFLEDAGEVSFEFNDIYHTEVKTEFAANYIF